MNTILFLRTGTDAVLFSEELQHIPQPGDLVTYSFEANDKWQWSPDLYARNTDASASVSEWQVTKVQHLIRRLGMRSLNHTVFVFISPRENGNFQ